MQNNFLKDNFEFLWKLWSLVEAAAATDNYRSCHQPNMVHYSAISRGQTSTFTACNGDCTAKPNHILHFISGNYYLFTLVSQHYVILFWIGIYCILQLFRLWNPNVQNICENCAIPTSLAGWLPSHRSTFVAEILLIFSCAVARVERLNWPLLCLVGWLSVDCYKKLPIFKISSDFKNSKTKMCFGTCWGTLVFGLIQIRTPPPLHTHTHTLGSLQIWLDTSSADPLHLILHLTPYSSSPCGFISLSLFNSLP